MGKGGYKIIDLRHKASGSTIKGIYEAIESNLYKPLLLENIVIGDNEVTNQYVEVTISGTDFILKNDTIKVTIDDDDIVTIALNEINSIKYKNASGTDIGNLKFVKCSQAEYDALTKDNNTFYIIVG